jgi:transketolase
MATERNPNFDAELEGLAANTIRGLAMDAVQKANSGHPGMPMGMADAAVVLWTRFYKHNPARPDWIDRDRFVLSAGHGSMLLYSLLHLTGYALPLEELKEFRQWESMTPGHPEYGAAPGIETTTGPLGQGFANGVGMALAERMLAARFNDGTKFPIDHYTFAIVSDGDLMEGISHEAASLAGHLGLGKLIYLYDDNHITIDGPTDLAYSDDVRKRFEGYGWQVLAVDGHDREAVAEAITEAGAEIERPTLIMCRTHIAFGSPNKQDKASAHGEPLGPDEVRLTKEKLGIPLEPEFFVPRDVRDAFDKDKGRLQAAWQQWDARFGEWRKANPEKADLWDAMMSGKLPRDLAEKMPKFEVGKSIATRAASGDVLQVLAEDLPGLVGGSGDLTPSNKTFLKGFSEVKRGDFSGRNIHFGVREHAMGAILSGMALHGGLIPYGGTFLVFSDYMRPSIRLAAMMGLEVVYVFTHDSVFVGEDGPTHQPIEQVAALRAIPNLDVIRPADANETAVAWQMALERHDGPTALILTRQGLPTLDRASLGPADGLRKGGYVLSDDPDPEMILIATGSEVSLALGAADILRAQDKKVRVVNLGCWEAFERQPEEYRRSVLPREVQKRVSIEAGRSLGWDRYVGDSGETISLDDFGASAPAKVLAEKLGLTPESVAARALRLL